MGQPSLLYERELQDLGSSRIAGVDEVGRGPLAGPVVAAACILPVEELLITGWEGVVLRDSKQLNESQREETAAWLMSHPRVFYGIGMADVREIDRLNILQATFLAMFRAVQALPEVPDHLLVDGPLVPRWPRGRKRPPVRPLVKGDALSLSIAAASILAKVTRDRWMVEKDAQWPQYGFRRHKGYGTPEHLAALQAYGPCRLHRRSFASVVRMQDAWDCQRKNLDNCTY